MANDPTIGIVHEGRHGSSKFVFDLREPERPKLDRAVLDFVSKHVFADAPTSLRPTFAVGSAICLSRHAVREWPLFAHSGIADESRRLAFVRIILAPGLPLFRGTSKAFAEPCQRLPKRMGDGVGQASSCKRVAENLTNWRAVCPHVAR